MMAVSCSSLIFVTLSAGPVSITDDGIGSKPGDPPDLGLDTSGIFSSARYGGKNGWLTA